MSDLIKQLRAHPGECDCTLGPQAADALAALNPVCVAHGCMQQRHFVSIRKLQARIEELEEAVAQQAEDDGLWFIAETAPEAYLQNALRYLHALIEQDARALAAIKGAESDG